MYVYRLHTTHNHPLFRSWKLGQIITLPPDLVATTTEDANKFTLKSWNKYAHLPEFCP